MGLFQILRIDYGLLILSRSVIAWSAFAVVINSLCVAAYARWGGCHRGCEADVAQGVKGGGPGC
jgi:hypothetical protein